MRNEIRHKVQRRKHAGTNRTYKPSVHHRDNKQIANGRQPQRARKTRTREKGKDKITASVIEDKEIPRRECMSTIHFDDGIYSGSDMICMCILRLGLGLVEQSKEVNKTN